MSDLVVNHIVGFPTRRLNYSSILGSVVILFLAQNQEPTISNPYSGLVSCNIPENDPGDIVPRQQT